MCIFICIFSIYAEYTLSYIQLVAQCKKKSDVSHISKSDIVTAHDDSLPRWLWKLGRIQELFTGQDGLPCNALVRVTARDQQHTLLKRPLQLLYPLEVAGAEEPEVTGEVAGAEGPEVTVENAERDVCSTSSDQPVVRE